MGGTRVAGAAMAVAVALAACGAFGTADPATPLEAGAAADGSGETGTTDAPAPRPDAPFVRPADVGTCPKTTCASGDPNCTDDTCDEVDWERTGQVTHASGDCRAKAPAKAAAYLSNDTPVTEAKRFVDFQFLAHPVEAPGKTVIGRIAAGTHTLNVVFAAGKLSLCEGDGATEVGCSPAGGLLSSGNEMVRVFGQLTGEAPYGSFVLQLDCKDIATLTLAAPLTGALTANVGCVASTDLCDFVVDDITFSVNAN